MAFSFDRFGRRRRFAATTRQAAPTPPTPPPTAPPPAKQPPGQQKPPKPKQNLNAGSLASIGLLVPGGFRARVQQLGAAVGSGDDMTLISTTTLAVDGTFDVSGISASYNDLYLVLVAHSADAGNSDNAQLRFNNDSATHYIDQWLQGNVSTSLALEHTGLTSFRLGSIPATGLGVPSLYAYHEVIIPGYASTAWQKLIRTSATYAVGVTSGNATVLNVAGQWNQTTAITRVQIFGNNTANLTAGSQLRIYGRL